MIYWNILGHFTQYVPTTMDQKGIAEQLLFGGDQRTAERTRSAKALQLNNRTGLVVWYMCTCYRRSSPDTAVQQQD